jgi:hypothetical protein
LFTAATIGASSGNGAVAVARTLANHFADVVNVRDFGAVGDGVADDTAAIQAAINIANGRKVFIPSGTFLVQYLTYQPSSNIPIYIFGSGVNNTIIKKTGSSTNSVLLIGQNPSPFFITNNKICDLTIDGTNKTGRACLQMLDCWYTTLTNIRLLNSIVGLELLTPIFLEAESITSLNNIFGVNISYFPGESFLGSQPGVLNFVNSVFTNNVEWGLKFDDGTTLVLRNCAIENNGTTVGAVNEGGVFVGTNVGRFNVGTITPGITLRDCHFEGNKGQASVKLLSGKNILENVFFWEGLTGTTNDVRIEGGYYYIYNSTSAAIKFPNVFEAASGVGIGNMILNSSLQNITGVNQQRTAVFNDATLKSPYITIGGTQGPAAALTFENSTTYWDLKQIGGTSFGLYNGIILAAYWDLDRNFSPGSDGTLSLGKAVDRWSVVYATTPTINTSDKREKTFLEIEDAEKLAALEIKQNLRKFKFNSAIEKKGEGARIHFGASAQQIGEIMTSHGLDPNRYGFYCYDEWEEKQEIKNEKNETIQEYRPAGNRYGLRYEELLAFIISAL